MFKRLNVVAFSMLIASFVVGQAALAGTSPAPSPKPQATCPIMGGTVDKTQYVDYQGKRIYVCCGGCKSEVAKNPAKYIAKIEALGQSVETLPSAKSAPAASKPKPQTLCPVLGNPIDTSLYVDYQGRRIYVCCAKCIDRVKADPAKYLKKIEKSGESVRLVPWVGTGKNAPAAAKR